MKNAFTFLKPLILYVVNTLDHFLQSLIMITNPNDSLNSILSPSEQSFKMKFSVFQLNDSKYKSMLRAQEDLF